MDTNRDRITLTLATLSAVILGSLGIAAEQALQTIIYLVLAAPSFVLSIYSTFFKDKLVGGVIVFPQPFGIGGAVGKNFQLKGSVMNMGDMPTLVEISPYDPERVEQTKIWVYPNGTASDTKPLMDGRFVLHPGDIFFLETTVKEGMANLDIPFSFIDKKGRRVQVTETVEID
ncbi:MAG: hypothetical protein ACXAE3_00140 [Candidatus Kariarchaeaceae archaeon]